jgi:hypothetical protein
MALPLANTDLIKTLNIGIYTPEGGGPAAPQGFVQGGDRR